MTIWSLYIGRNVLEGYVETQAVGMLSEQSGSGLRRQLQSGKPRAAGAPVCFWMMAWRRGGWKLTPDGASCLPVVATVPQNF
ncbi:hypothetical protein HBI95_098200 [Parastagonospora nodorum]|nr:hypothetical protein HBI95_098200 [Parastagonospora nodorum]